MIEKNLKKYLSELSQYTELRMQDNRSLNMSFLNGNMIVNSKSSNNGVSARVYKNGSWGFASCSELDESSIKEIIRLANYNANFLDVRANKKRAYFTKTIGNIENELKSKKNIYSQSEIKDFLKEMDNYISSKYPNLAQRFVGIRSISMERSLVTSDTSTFYSFIPQSALIVQLTLMKENTPYNIFKLYGGLGEIQDVLTKPSDFYKEVDNLYNLLIDKSEGIHTKSGLKEVVLDSSISGILAHEAIGHTTEADLVLGGSIAGDYFNKQIANENVTLIDFAHSYNGKLLPIPIFMDDEGTKAEDVVIIEKGILKNYMHNKDTAERFNTVPKGNARAWEFSDEPLIRMRNTAILPGTNNLNEMISSIEDGYYIMKTTNGQADTTSEFTFSVNLGYEIKNGKLGKAIKDTTISGVAFDVLKSVSMISNEMKWNSFGVCGKKQPIPVGMGGPSIKCVVNIGGE